MDNKKVDKLVKKPTTKAGNDSKNPQERQVIATSGVLRVRVQNGKTNN